MQPALNAESRAAQLLTAASASLRASAAAAPGGRAGAAGGAWPLSTGAFAAAALPAAGDAGAIVALPVASLLAGRAPRLVLDPEAAGLAAAEAGLPGALRDLADASDRTDLVGEVALLGVTVEGAGLLAPSLETLLTVTVAVVVAGPAGFEPVRLARAGFAVLLGRSFALGSFF